MNEGTGQAVVRTDPLRSFCDNLSCQEMSISLCTQMKYKDRPLKLVHLYQAFQDQVGSCTCIWTIVPFNALPNRDLIETIVRKPSAISRPRNAFGKHFICEWCHWYWCAWQRSWEQSGQWSAYYISVLIPYKWLKIRITKKCSPII